MKNKAT